MVWSRRVSVLLIILPATVSAQGWGRDPIQRLEGLARGERRGEGGPPVDGVRAGNLVHVGIRARLGLGALAVYPSVGLSTGALVSTADGTRTSLSGFRGGLTVRWR